VATVRFLAPDTDAFVASVERHRDEFERASGHTLRIDILPSDTYFANEIQGHLAGDDPPDVFMSGPVLLWEHMAAGLVEPLDDHVGGAGDGYDPDDFLPPVIAANRWTGRFGDPLGEGPLLEIPVNCESYNLAYVPETLDRCGLEPPTTWREFFDVAEQVVACTGGSVRGFGQRGVPVWHTVYTGYATQFWSYGATDFDASGRCAIASPEGVAATEDFIDALRRSGPEGWTEQRWYELALDFAAGRYGLLVDSDHYVAFFESPEHSRLVGRICYALPPEGPTGIRAPNLWTWSMAMNARSRDKRAAWDLIEWASGRQFLLRSAFEGNMNPTRASVWDDPGFAALTEPWGQFHAVSRRLAEDIGRVLVRPAANYRDFATRWTRALHDAYLGVDEVSRALATAADDIDAMVA
jgi:multiple sugar transport system substrate-binding protein